MLGLIFVNIRGFASPEWFLQWLPNPPVPTGDAAVWWMIVGVVFAGKSIALLAFLLGAGLAMQERRVARVGGSFRWLVLRRMLVLLGFGVLHIGLLWWGDVLGAYAVMGIGFLLFAGRSSRVLRIWAGLLIGGVCLGLAGLGLLGIGGGSEPDPAMGIWVNEMMENARQVYTVGTWGDVAAFRLFEAAITQGLFLFVLPFYFGLLLAGYDLTRAGWLDDPRRIAALGGTRWFGWAVAVAVAGNVAGTWATEFEAGAWWGWMIFSLIGMPAMIGLSAIYAIGLTNWALTGGRAAAAVAAVGRMALSNYLLQSVLAALVFHGYGLGLYDQLGATAVMGIALGMVGGQLLWSTWWLRRFRFGPMEWLWRLGVYGWSGVRGGSG